MMRSVQYYATIKDAQQYVAIEVSTLPLGEVVNMAAERAAILSDETGLDVEFEITETTSKR